LINAIDVRLEYNAPIAGFVVLAEDA